MNPLVSVILPTYNSSRTLVEALQSALGQTHRELEVIVVLDGCSDDTASLLDRIDDPRLVVVDLPTNSGGPAAPRNAATSIARGRYLAYLGHDDLWFPDHLESALQALDDAGLNFVSTLGVLLDSSGAAWRFGLPRSESDRGISPSTWVHRHPLPDGVGWWDPAVALADDVAFLATVRAAGVTTGVVDRITVVKFPSAWWRLYRATDGPPLREWREGIRVDPEAVRRSFEAIPWIGEQTLRHPRIRRLAERYGWERWPLRPLRIIRLRRRRGLPVIRRK